MKKSRKIIITMVAIFIWCGMMYPELSFPDGVLSVSEDGGEEWRSCTLEQYYDFLTADREQIEVKSRLLEIWNRG